MGLLLSVSTAPIAVSMALQKVGAGRGRTRQGAGEAGGGFVDGEETAGSGKKAWPPRVAAPVEARQAVADQKAKPRERASVGSAGRAFRLIFAPSGAPIPSARKVTS